MRQVAVEREVENDTDHEDWSGSVIANCTTIVGSTQRDSQVGPHHLSSVKDQAYFGPKHLSSVKDQAYFGPKHLSSVKAQACVKQ
jgi:hypothetical protein